MLTDLSVVDQISELRAKLADAEKSLAHADEMAGKDAAEYIALQDENKQLKAALNFNSDVDIDELINDVAQAAFDRAVSYDWGFDVGKGDQVRAEEALKQAYLAAAALKWIPVSDRLPEKSGTYIAFIVPTTLDDQPYLNGARVEPCQFIKKIGWNLYFSTVTHWMPMPQGPEVMK